MSALAFCYRRDRRPVDAAHFEAVFNALDHRGLRGPRTLRGDGWAVGRHGPASEEDDPAQPLGDHQNRIFLVFDGRLDNREELASILGIREDADDARFVLRAYRRWGTGCFERLLGSFAVVIVDEAKRRVACARDALGNRTLFFRLTDREFWAASEVGALLRHPDVSHQPDEQSLARFFAVRAPRPGATFFREIRELEPAEVLVVEPRRSRSFRYWRPEPDRTVRYKRDPEYVEHFLELLRLSVESRLRGQESPVVLMGGGLASTSVAALAARHSRLRNQDPVLAVSWVFNQFVQSDERDVIVPVVGHCGLQSVQIPADDCGPLERMANPSGRIDSPHRSLRRGLLDRCYRSARLAGRHVVLTGEFCDPLFSGGRNWLRSLSGEGRLLEASLGLFRECAGSTGRLRAALGAMGRETPVDFACGWLTTRARRLVEPDKVDLRSSRPEPLAAALDPCHAMASGLELLETRRADVEIRRPYRDRRLVEFLLAVPAHQLYRPGRPRWILRQAMAGLLPEEVRWRRRRKSLAPLYRRGLQSHLPQVLFLLGGKDALWREFVKSEWLEPLLRKPAQIGAGIESLVPWQCINAQLWRQRHRSASFSEAEVGRVA